MANNFLKDNEKIIGRLLLGVGAYFTIIKPLLQKTNIVDTKEEKAKKAADEAAKIESSSGSSISPYSYASFFANIPVGTKISLVTNNNAIFYSKKLHDAFNYFNFANQYNEITAFGVLDALKTQSEFAWIAKKYWSLYSESLFDYLKQCLTEKEFTDFNTKLMSKPKYTPKA